MERLLGLRAEPVALTRATLETAPRSRREWAGQFGIVGPSYMASTGSGLTFGNGTTYLPFTATGTDAGEVPTSYEWNGMNVPALAHDSAIIDFRLGSWERNNRGVIYDLMWVGSITASSATITVNSPTLPARDLLGGTNGVNCHLVVWAQGAITLTVSYTNSAGTAGQTATAVVTATGGPLIFDLAAGDDGVRSVQSMTSTSATVAYRIAIVRRVATVRVISPAILGLAQLPEQMLTSRMHNIHVVKAGALLFPTWSQMGNVSSRSNYAQITLVEV